MEEAVAADGHVRVIYRDWPIFGPLSEQAARVAIASNYQGIYPAVHHRLMAERRRLDMPVLREAIERSGGNWERLQRDLSVHAADIDQQIARTRYDVVSLGIEGTPAYLVGPTLIRGATNRSEFEKAIELARRTRRVPLD